MYHRSANSSIVSIGWMDNHPGSLRAGGAASSWTARCSIVCLRGRMQCETARGGAARQKNRGSVLCAARRRRLDAWDSTSTCTTSTVVLTPSTCTMLPRRHSTLRVLSCACLAWPAAGKQACTLYGTGRPAVGAWISRCLRPSASAQGLLTPQPGCGRYGEASAQHAAPCQLRLSQVGQWRTGRPSL